MAVVAVMIDKKNVATREQALFSLYIYTERFKNLLVRKKGKRKDQRVPQSQTAALPRHQEEEETDKSKQA